MYVTYTKSIPKDRFGARRSTVKKRRSPAGGPLAATQSTPGSVAIMRDPTSCPSATSYPSDTDMALVSASFISLLGD